MYSPYITTFWGGLYYSVRNKVFALNNASSRTVFPLSYLPPVKTGGYSYSTPPGSALLQDYLNK